MVRRQRLGYLILADEQGRAVQGEALRQSRYTGVVETRQPAPLYHAYVAGEYRATHWGLAAAVARLDRHHRLAAPLEAVGALLADGANLLDQWARRLSTRAAVSEFRRLREEARMTFTTKA